MALIGLPMDEQQLAILKILHRMEPSLLQWGLLII